MNTQITMSAGRKKRRRYMKINLMETSAVGIPAYPDAHMSFMKALHNYTYTNERRFELNKMSETEQTVAKQTPEVQEEVQETPKVEENAETPAEEATEKVEEPAKENAEETTEEETEKSVSNDEKLVKLLSEAVEQAIEKSTVKRGLIESPEDAREKAKEELSKMSAGELAIKSGWFRKF